MSGAPQRALVDVRDEDLLAGLDPPQGPHHEGVVVEREADLGVWVAAVVDHALQLEEPRALAVEERHAEVQGGVDGLYETLRLLARFVGERELGRVLDVDAPGGAGDALAVAADEREEGAEALGGEEGLDALLGEAPGRGDAQALERIEELIAKQLVRETVIVAPG